METVLSSGRGGEISVINNHGTSRLLIGQLPSGASPRISELYANTLFYPQMLSGVHKERVRRCGFRTERVCMTAAVNLPLWSSARRHVESRAFKGLGWISHSPVPI